MSLRNHTRASMLAFLLAMACTATAQELPAKLHEAASVKETATKPALDIEEMRRAVRAMKLDEEEPVRQLGKAFSAAPDTAKERFRRKFDSGKRPWCLTAFQGAGVLAPLAMTVAHLIDKKDHGCKW